MSYPKVSMEGKKLYNQLYEELEPRKGIEYTPGSFIYYDSAMSTIYDTFRDFNYNVKTRLLRKIEKEAQ